MVFSIGSTKYRYDLDGNCVSFIRGRPRGNVFWYAPSRVWREGIEVLNRTRFDEYWEWLPEL